GHSRLRRRRADKLAGEREEVVGAKHTVARLGDGAARLLEALLGDRLLDRGDRLRRVVDVERGERARGKIALEIGAAPIERMREAEKGIGELLCPVVGKCTVLEGDVIAVGQYAVGLVRQPIDAPPKDVDRGAEMLLQAADE